MTCATSECFQEVADLLGMRGSSVEAVPSSLVTPGGRDLPSLAFEHCCGEQWDLWAAGILNETNCAEFPLIPFLSIFHDRI